MPVQGVRMDFPLKLPVQRATQQLQVVHLADLTTKKLRKDKKSLQHSLGVVCLLVT